MPKPNTMDDLDEILEALHWLPIQDRYDEPHPIYPGDNGLSDEHVKKAKALITAKLQEVDRAARIGTLDWLENNASSGGDWRRKIILKRDELLASLKGGDVKADKFYATLWFGSFSWDNFEIEPGREFEPITIAHPVGIMKARFRGDIKVFAESADIPNPLKKMVFEYRGRYGARHLKYVFSEEL